MKYIIISDIHGNIDALKEFIKEIESSSFDSIIMCGDYVTDFPNSHEVISTLIGLSNKYKCYIVKGNRDQNIIDYKNGKNFEIKQLKNIEYTYNSLSKEDVEWLESLPEEIVININNKIIYVSHKCNNYKKCDYKIFGHTHTQENYIENNIRYINPGSVGITTDQKIGAEYTILEINDKVIIEEHLIKYDIDKVINKLRKTPIYNDEVKWGQLLEKELLTGIDYPYNSIEEYNKYLEENKLIDKDLEIWSKIIKENIKR